MTLFQRPSLRQAGNEGHIDTSTKAANVHRHQGRFQAPHRRTFCGACDAVPSGVFCFCRNRDRLPSCSFRLHLHRLSSPATPLFRLFAAGAVRDIRHERKMGATCEDRFWGPDFLETEKRETVRVPLLNPPRRATYRSVPIGAGNCRFSSLGRLREDTQAA